MTQDITADYSHLPSRPAHAMYLQTDLESLNPPQTCSHCLSGTPELWSTVAACFDDMLSAHDNLGRLPVDNPSLYPRAATVGSSAYNNQQSNASKLATSGCISDRLSPVYSNSSLPSQESDHQLPPMPKSSTHAGLQLSLVSFTVRRPKMKTSKFIGSLYDMLDDPDTSSMISWSKNGEAFIVHDIAKFQKRLLPKHYKHSKFTSFVRQLSAYGFKRAYLPEVAKTACPNAKKPRRKYDEPSYPMDYFHPDFKRGRKDLLPLILRKLREHAEVTDGSVPSAGASPATTTNGLEEEAAILEAKQAVDLPQQPEQYIRDCLAEDTWKAILGPVLSNERNTAPDGPQESPNCPAASGFSTPSASPEENDFNPFTSFFTYEPPRFQPKEGSSPVDSLNTLMTNLPEDPATLRSLLQQTQMLSSQIQERLFGTCATWLVKSSAQVPEHAAWNLLSTGWSHPLSAQQHSSNDMPFSAPGPSRPESAVPIFIQSALPL